MSARLTAWRAAPVGGAPRLRLARRQRGVFAVMFAGVLLMLLAICGCALSLGMIYNRKAELHGVAKAAALAAARQLNGTGAGVDAARTAAANIANQLVYQYHLSVRWDDNALTFSSAPDRSGSWVDAPSAVSQPSMLFFAKVDTVGLDLEVGSVGTMFMAALSGSLANMHIGHSVVAGRTAVNVTPLAVCAMSNTAADGRPNTTTANAELVEYGFRRGVSYDLMQLSPTGAVPNRYLVHPVLSAGWYSADFDTSVMGPFICSGDMWVQRILVGGNIRVTPLPTTQPLASFYRQLNTRFEDYGSGDCSSNGAAPDTNVKSYAYDQAGGAPWMAPATGERSAHGTAARGKLETIADLSAPPPGTTAGQYGPLWVQARAVKYASYVAQGGVEPANGYATFSTSDWPALYPAAPVAKPAAASPTAPGYPTTGYTPYWSGLASSVNFQPPSSANTELATPGRRILYMPLLSCPAPSGANVGVRALAIGRFFMTVPATPDSLVAEFGGIVPEAALAPRIEVFP